MSRPAVCCPKPVVDLDCDRSEPLGIAADVMRAVHAAGHVDVDHVELFGPPTSPTAGSLAEEVTDEVGR